MSKAKAGAARATFLLLMLMHGLPGLTLATHHLDFSAGRTISISGVSNGNFISAADRRQRWAREQSVCEECLIV
ncbi:hypothetical protein [uncultured Rhodoblastus sp.]|uniref:hypothetical protein n=1 Tax=uncultured Rhodoblastus sp. TaxID=543037 RepID=UPI0025E9572E|nr:hypothetical protein [uncultured Rhodoblastus sp.]